MEMGWSSSSSSLLLLLLLSSLLLTEIVKGDYCVNATTYSMTSTTATDIVISTFNNCTGATNVNISNNLITYIDNQTFYLIWQIETLDLSFNNLTEIKSGTFSNLRQLTDLFITNNYLKTLPLDFFFNKLSLVSVDVSYNNISEIPLPVFKQKMPNIRNVILHHNNLSAFEPWGIAYELDYQVIPHIDVRYNNIHTFTNDYNFEFSTRTVYDESETDVRFNKLTGLPVDFLKQYKTNTTQDAEVATIMAQIGADIRNNTISCDCNMYPITHSFRDSYFLFYKEDKLKIDCYSPPELRGQLVLYDVRLSEFVCNVTQQCPTGCLCQERPYDAVIHVDCTNASLTNNSIPRTLPPLPRNLGNLDYNAYELVLADNDLTRLDDVPYATQLALLQASNNTISYISEKLVAKMAESEESKLFLQNNELIRVPETMKNIKYQNVQLEGNALVCDCDMLWMKQWIKLAPKYVDKSLDCSFEGDLYRIIDLDEDILNCSNVGNVLLVVFLSIGLAIVISLLVTAKRCPYATKVLIFKIFRIHPADQYAIDTLPDKEYDAYVAYDEDDCYVRQWVEKVMWKQLEDKKPHYKLFIGVRDKKVGVEAESRVEAMENSRRLIIILSENFTRKRWCDYDACQAETLELNKGRVIFVLYDKHGEELSQNEPWLSKTKDRKVFHLNERMFWSKMRYEMPRKAVKSPTIGYRARHHGHSMTDIEKV